MLHKAYVKLEEAQNAVIGAAISLKDVDRENAVEIEKLSKQIYDSIDQFKRLINDQITKIHLLDKERKQA